MYKSKNFGAVYDLVYFLNSYKIPKENIISITISHGDYNWILIYYENEGEN